MHINYKHNALQPIITNILEKKETKWLEWS